MIRYGPARILLVDDNADIRYGLALILAEDGAYDCVEAADPDEARDALARGKPDAALVDLSPGTEAALQLVTELCAQDIPVLVCSMHEEPSYVRHALDAGARGYLTKREAPRELGRAVRDILDGWMLVSPRAMEGLRHI